MNSAANLLMVVVIISHSLLLQALFSQRLQALSDQAACQSFMSEIVKQHVSYPEGTVCRDSFVPSFRVGSEGGRVCVWGGGGGGGCVHVRMVWHTYVVLYFFLACRFALQSHDGSLP